MSKFSSLAILSCKYRHIYTNRLLTQYSLLKGPKILMKYHNLHFYINLEGKNTPTIFLYMHLYPCLRSHTAKKVYYIILCNLYYYNKLWHLPKWFNLYRQYLILMAYDIAKWNSGKSLQWNFCNLDQSPWGV